MPPARASAHRGGGLRLCCVSRQRLDFHVRAPHVSCAQFFFARHFPCATPFPAPPRSMHLSKILPAFWLAACHCIPHAIASICDLLAFMSKMLP